MNWTNGVIDRAGRR